MDERRDLRQAMASKEKRLPQSLPGSSRLGRLRGVRNMVLVPSPSLPLMLAKFNCELVSDAARTHWPEAELSHRPPRLQEVVTSKCWHGTPL